MRVNIFATALALGTIINVTDVSAKKVKSRDMQNEKIEKNEKIEQPWILDRFDDIKVLRYEVPGFHSLPLNEKIYIYYLAKAAEAGQTIFIDQKFEHNLLIRSVFDTIINFYEGTRECAEWAAFEKYAKKFWFANGIHHHYSNMKFTPEFSQTYFEGVVRSVERSLPLGDDLDLKRVLSIVLSAIFDAELYKTNLSRQEGADVVALSACNYYSGGVTQKEAEAFYEQLTIKGGDSKVSWGLNSQLVKGDDGALYERVYKLGGLYSAEIEKIIYWLEKAATVANAQQREIIELLVDYYRTGDLNKFDEYSIAWVGDKTSNVDFINGFIEVYGDPLCRKGAWEAMVNFKNVEASHRTEVIAENAQWFEDRAPINPAYRKPKVKGVSAKVITAAMLAGDSYPATPIGINLPNAEWIRRDYGSKSVTIDNITHAYAQSTKGSGFNREFYIDEATRELVIKYGEVSDSMHTDLHECLGHGSGQLADGVSQDALGSYHSVIEECRADLFGLYFVADQKMVDLGLLPSRDAAKAQYVKYLTNGMLTQLSRIKLGDDVEQTHMRNRKIISEWILARGNAASLVERGGKYFIEVNDFEALRGYFGELLMEIQRMKSEGDREAARELIERYGVKIDQKIHSQILDRYAALDIEPYSGFVNPTYELVMEGDKIVDVDIVYPTKIW